METSPEGKLPPLEVLKLSYDWCKHVSTMSTGCIVLMITFLDKLARQPEWKALLYVSFSGFVASILGSFGVQLDHLAEARYPSGKWFGVCGVLMLIGFLSGIISLAVFALRNI